MERKEFPNMKEAHHEVRSPKQVCCTNRPPVCYTVSFQQWPPVNIKGRHSGYAWAPLNCVQQPNVDGRLQQAAVSLSQEASCETEEE